ncbi:ATPase [Xylocopilactobacillus apis]|uniref:ATPase n=2 Tax=Xylocopilactobacillus apis TaxID=2932183 RepID=A0AAU9DJP1_9LACO|nr:ATPase [Xylocopilactobacillus apis]
MHLVIAFTQVLLLWGIYYSVARKISLFGFAYSVLYFFACFAFLTRLSVFMIIPFFFVYSLLKKFSISQSIFLSVYSASVALILTNFVEQTFMIFVSDQVFKEYNDIFTIISLILPIFLHYIVTKIYRIDWRLLNRNNEYIQKKIISPLNIIISLIFIIFLGVYFYEFYYNRQDIDSSRYLVFFLIFIFFGIETFISQKIDRYFQHELQEIKDKQIQQLGSYTSEIEAMYQTLRGFRHDYLNIFLTLKSSIKAGDITEIRQIYGEMENSSSMDLTTAVDFSDLSNVKNSALKSVLYWKLTEAKKDHIQVELEIEEVIDDLEVDLIDLVRMISILIDNATEEAKKTAEPMLKLALFKKDETLMLVIQNNTNETNIPLGKIFNANFSTKKNHQGIGLYNLKKIVDSYDFVELDTEVSNNSFTQIISINEEQL